ncbi:Flp family type IVb pilin [Facilibium subflavum]|uniref:Flp family type IVb pilin n=1 Tax=Facilibium subflavum TaxID=2219058 RepID=UPI000E64E5C0|nr:Flp family type IVb pilin [Facilibium subflavum]
MLLKTYCQIKAALCRFKNDQQGVTAVEYGMIAIAMGALIAVVFAWGGSDSIVHSLYTQFQSLINVLTSWGNHINP